MFGHVTMDKVIEFTRSCVTLTFCWPISPTASKSQVLRFKILRSAVTLNSIAFFLFLAYAVYVYRDDLIEMSKAACLALAALQAVAQTFFSIAHYDNFQGLIQELMVCCKKATSYEKTVYHRYIDMYSTFYGLAAMWFYMTAILVAMGTLLISQPFPTNAEYPFPVDRKPVSVIIFLHQSIAGMQIAAHVCLNMFGALLLLFSAARFEILGTELREVILLTDLIKCVNKYYHLKRYAQEAANSVRFFALNTVIVSAVALAFGSINCLGNQPFMVKSQFMSIGGTALLAVFMSALPADHLIDVSENFAYGVYESKWYNQALGMQKNILYALLPQKPVAIKITCVIPTLSLNYYCTYVSNMFSFFTALRVTMAKNND